MNDSIRPQHVILKALALYAIANIAFAYFQPAIGKLSIYNFIVPGRERTPYEREISNYPISHTIPVYEDMDAMYQTLTLSEPKAENEFRVFLIGDSATWGFHLRPEETLNGQINTLNLTACDGRKIVSYNAAFPLPYAMKDLIVLDKLLEYQPDMFIWLVTLDGMRNRTIFSDYFLDPYAPRVHELVETYDIKNLDTSKMKEQTFLDRTIIGQRSRLKKVFLLQLHGFGWSASGLDYYYDSYNPVSNDQSSDLTVFEIEQSGFSMDEMLFDALEAGHQHAGDVPMLFVNEPIFISTGANSDIRFNDFYPRWANDDYIAYLDRWTSQNGFEYVNAWDLLPPVEFTDSPFHRTPKGESVFANALKEKILDMACEK